MSLVIMNYCLMQMIQLILIILRICFLFYLLTKAIINKEDLHKMFAQSAWLKDMDQDQIYTFSVMSITLILMVPIGFTFVYNYFIVHETFTGVCVMTIFLSLSFLLTIGKSFRDTSAPIIEAVVENLLSLLEICLSVILVFFIRNKRKVKYIKNFEKRFPTFV